MEKQADLGDILMAVAPYVAGAGGGWLVGKALERLTGIPGLSWALGAGGLAAPAIYQYLAGEGGPIEALPEVLPEVIAPPPEEGSVLLPGLVGAGIGAGLGAGLGGYATYRGWPQAGYSYVTGTLVPSIRRGLGLQGKKGRTGLGRVGEAIQGGFDYLADLTRRVAEQLGLRKPPPEPFLKRIFKWMRLR